MRSPEQVDGDVDGNIVVLVRVVDADVGVSVHQRFVELVRRVAFLVQSCVDPRLSVVGVDFGIQVVVVDLDALVLRRADLFTVIAVLDVGVLRSAIRLFDVDCTCSATWRVRRSDATLRVHVAVPGLTPVDPDRDTTSAATAAVTSGSGAALTVNEPETVEMQRFDVKCTTAATTGVSALTCLTFKLDQTIDAQVSLVIPLQIATAGASQSVAVTTTVTAMRGIIQRVVGAR